MPAATLPTSNIADLLRPGPSRAAAEAAVNLVDVRKTYIRGTTHTRVLDGCTMSVGRGECAFLLGPSGSGKTTLLSIIGCVLSADSGEVSVLGRDVKKLSAAASAALRRKELGFVFQRFHLIRGLSAVENVCLPLTLEGVSPAKAQRRGRELLAMVGLANQADSDPRRMSVGQCQRIALARALVADPPLILADEPTAALDAESGQQAMRLLRRLTVEAGKTAIVVTHDSRILPFADRIFSMENGRLAETEAAHLIAH
jgi:putative ABC transport system ATP-binding protein